MCVRRRPFLATVGASTGIFGAANSIEFATATNGNIEPVGFDSTASLLDSSRSPLTDDEIIAVQAEPTATNVDEDGNGDAVSYPDGTDIPLVAIDGSVAGIGTPLIPNDVDFGFGTEEFLLNLWDKIISGGTVLWDEGHEQFYDLASVSTFQAYAEGQGQFEEQSREYQYTVEPTTDILADLDTADAVVITSPSLGFDSDELSALSEFTTNGGAVILHTQSDFQNFDETTNINEVASALDAGFRFNDDQVIDSESNAGGDFVPVSRNFNEGEFPSLFQNRPGIDEAIALDPTQTYTVDVTDVADGDTVTVDFVNRVQTEEIRVLGVDTPEVAAAADAELAEEWEGLADRVGLNRLQFGSTASLLDTEMRPLGNETVAAYAEPSATNTDADENGDAVSYASGTPIPLAAVDGGVAGFGTPFVNDGALSAVGELDNEEFLLNVWDGLVGGSGTIRWDEGHGQFYSLSRFQTFRSYAEKNGYAVEAGTSIPSDTSAVDGLVITTPSDPFSDSELSALSSFVADGGAVFLHTQSDFDNFDATANINEIAAAVDASFRFNDDQVVDEQSNTGAPFRPTTTQFAVAKDLFREREGVDAELVVPAEGSPVQRLAFADGTAALVSQAGEPLTSDELVPVFAEPSATNEDSDGNGDATPYPDGEPIPLIALDGRVAGIGSPLVTDDTLNFNGEADNEEFLLNLWDSLLDESGTVRWDEGHDQFYALSQFSTFASYAEENGYTVETGTSIPSDTSAVSGLVITSPSQSFTETELSALNSFVADGGAVFLFDQSDFDNLDETANLNQIATALDTGFRFDDSQVFDGENNTGDPFRIVTENLNTEDFSLFAARPGIDDEGSAGFWENEFPYLSYWADQASTFAADELAGKRVDISFDPAGAEFNGGVRDPFGRVLAYIDYDATGDGTRDNNYNRRLIEQGYARSYGSSLSRLEDLLGAELTARKDGVGVWRQSNPDRSPTIRNTAVDRVFIPKAERVTAQGTTLSEDRTAVFSAATASPANAPLIAVDRDARVAAIGGLMIDEAYEAAEGFPVDTSEFGNFSLVGNVVTLLTDTDGPLLVAAGQGQFNASEGLSSEDVAFFQRFLEGVDVNLEGINDLTAERLSSARAVVLSTPLTELPDAELTALSDFTANGGAVILMGSSDAEDRARGILNQVAAKLGSDLRFTGQSVTDSTANLNQNSQLPVSDNFSEQAELAPLYRPYQPREATSDPPVSLLGSDGPVTDPDGDGLYEDLDGDGDVDIFDVQALLKNRDSQQIQSNASLFDFDRDGQVGIRDVQSLLNEIIRR